MNQQTFGASFHVPGTVRGTRKLPWQRLSTESIRCQYKSVPRLHWWLSCDLSDQMAFVFPFPLDILEFSFELFALWSKNTCFSFRYHVLTRPSQSKMNERGGEISYTSLFVTQTISILRLPSRLPLRSALMTSLCDVETVLQFALSKTASASHSSLVSPWTVVSVSKELNF